MDPVLDDSCGSVWPLDKGQILLCQGLLLGSTEVISLYFTFTTDKIESKQRMSRHILLSNTFFTSMKCNSKRIVTVNEIVIRLWVIV